MSAAPPAPLDPSAARSPLPPWVWLLAGVAVTALAGNRFNLAPLGWVAATPWLVHLRRTSGWRSRALLLAALQLGTFLQLLKIVTDPMPWFLALGFSVPMAAGSGLLYLTFEAARRRLGDGWGLALFPALVVAGESAAANLSELGTWGALAYTQLDNLPLLQVTALVGLGGVSLLLAATSALAALLVDAGPPRRWRRAAALVAALVLAAHAYGALRLDRPAPGPRVTVATIASDIGPGAGGRLPAPAALAAAEEALFARSARAMARGARLVVWNEGATVVPAAREAAFIARGQALARARGADLVLAYVVPRDGMRRFENKYVWLTPEGPVETYLKHHPVPGEGSIRGTAPIRVLRRPYGRVAGAICYDYDFPALARRHARGGAGLVVVPSSDWRGIDPIHTEMARVRGIEGGFSVVRAVRWATSAAYDAFGRPRATASYAEGERVMLARVPATRVPTLYARVGEVLPAAALGLLLVAGGLLLIRRRRRG